MMVSVFACENFDYEILGITESYIIDSQIVEDEFTIYVYLPPSYTEGASNFPLIVGMDGDNEFDTMARIISNEINQGDIPEAIFVGVGYGSEELNDEKRNRDYTPTVTNGVEPSETGSAFDFYKFLRDELIPDLESKYSINPSNTKTLMGHSYGGLFTLFALFQDRETNPFDKFIPVASSLWYDSGSLFEFEESYAQIHDDLAVKVYTTMGSLEGGVMIASFAEMNDKINARQYPSLTYYSELLEKFGHSRSDYPSYEKALPYVFNP